MFRRRLVLVDDSIAVELGRTRAYCMLLTMQYQKSGMHAKQSVPMQIRTVMSELFGTATVATSHTYLSANRIQSRTRNGSQWVFMFQLAQLIRLYLCHCLGLKPSSKVRKHSVYLHLVLCPTDPVVCPVVEIPVMTITGKTINGICSGSIPKLSRENFDRFLKSQSLSQEARLFLTPPEENGG